MEIIHGVILEDNLLEPAKYIGLKDVGVREFVGVRDDPTHTAGATIEYNKVE